MKIAENAFNHSPKYGKDFDWTGYTVHDAADILIRFLYRLPESVIPANFHEFFHDPLRDEEEFDYETTIREYRILIDTLLPPLSRQLLFYLLDLLAVFASKDEINKMTSLRLAAIFQPAIMYPVTTGRTFIKQAESCLLSQSVLVFLIENPDKFLIGISGSTS